jgi:serine/threonine protein kinase
MKELDIENIDDMSLASFEGEIQLLEGLPPHTNIVRYLYHERVEGKLRLYMMKYAGALGNRLRELRKSVDTGRGGIYSAKTIAKYCLDIAQGLAFLHSHQIVHRDLKVYLSAA